MAAITTVMAVLSLQTGSMPDKIALGGGEEQRQEIGLEPQHQHLAFGIAETDIVFDQLRARLRSIMSPAKSTP